MRCIRWRGSRGGGGVMDVDIAPAIEIDGGEGGRLDGRGSPPLFHNELLSWIPSIISQAPKMCCTKIPISLGRILHNSA